MQAISQVATGMLCDNEWERKKRSMESRTGISEATAVSGAFILYKVNLYKVYTSPTSQIFS